MRSALCAVLLGGCLIVRVTDDQTEDPCPEVRGQLLADASGPLAIGDAIYFTGANGTVSRVALEGGQVSELTPDSFAPLGIGVDATDLYFAARDAIWRKPLAGGMARAIAEGYGSLSALVVDDTSVVWAHGGGLERWSKADTTVEHLDDGDLIMGLAAFEGVYYYSLTLGDAVRRAPPVQHLATARLPGPLVVNDQGVYYYEIADPFIEYAGAIQLVPHDGGEVVTTAPNLMPVVALTGDDRNLYFVTANNVQYRVKQVSRFGGAVTTLACGYFESRAVALAVAGDFIYWTDNRGLYRLDRAAVAPN